MRSVVHRHLPGLWRWVLAGVAATVLSGLVLTIWGDAREFLWPTSPGRFLSSVQDLATGEHRVASQVLIATEGTNTEFVAVLLAPRIPRIYWNLEDESKRGPKPPLPEIVVVARTNSESEILYRLIPVALEDGYVRDAVDSFGLIAAMAGADIDGDGLDEAVVSWEAVGANRLFMFATVTEMTEAGPRTGDVLPSDFFVTRDNTFGYFAQDFTNSYASESGFVAHGLYDVFPGDGRIVVSVRTDFVSKLGPTTWEISSITSNRFGFAYSPKIAHRSIVADDGPIDVSITEDIVGTSLDTTSYYMRVGELLGEPARPLGTFARRVPQ